MKNTWFDNFLFFTLGAMITMSVFINIIDGKYTHNSLISANFEVDFECHNFQDVVTAKYEQERLRYEWMTFEDFANDWDFIARLGVLWDWNQECFEDQPDVVQNLF